MAQPSTSAELETPLAKSTSFWPGFWRMVFRFQGEKVTVWIGIRNTIGLVAPLAVCLALGHPAAGAAISTGALNVSFSDSNEPYRIRLRRMLAASFLVGIAVTAGSLSGRDNGLAVVTAAAWSFLAGMLVALSTSAADLGGVSLFTLVVYAARPLPFEQALGAGALAVLGGLIECALATTLWPVRRYAPELRALSNFYSELARMVALPVAAHQSPPATAQGMLASTTMAALSRDGSTEGERLRLLLSQAERSRLALLTLARLQARIQRDLPGHSAIPVLDRFNELAARLLEAIAAALRSGEAPDDLQGGLTAVSDLCSELPSDDDKSPEIAALLHDVRLQMDALAGQIRTAVELATSATRQGASAFARREARRPWRLRLGGTIATLRANLTFRSTACRHAVRLMVAVGIGDMIGRIYGVQRSYWIPMTTGIVLKPDFAATFTRGVLRFMGTLVGLIFATAAFHILQPGMAGQIVLIAALMFVMRAYGSANYGLLVAPVTALVVLLIAITGVAPNQVMLARGLNTLIGGALALGIYWLWPTWERTQISEVLATMLDVYRQYFRSIRNSYLHPNEDSEETLDEVRAAARVARTNAEASVERVAAEPGITVETVRALSGIMAASHRFVHATMALDAGLGTSEPAPPRAAFTPFANDVERTLHSLAHALRGSSLQVSDLPDLRQDHNALVRSHVTLTERYALVNIETDRITNSLNTLSEEVVRWMSPAKSA